MTPEEKSAWLAKRTPQDIINSLRGIYPTANPPYLVTPLQKTAADLIEQLLKENEGLRGELEGKS